MAEKAPSKLILGKCGDIGISAVDHEIESFMIRVIGKIWCLTTSGLYRFTKSCLNIVTMMVVIVMNKELV